MSQKKVLLVDDVELFLELERTFFRREGFELLVARNGREAYETVVKHRPDLVLMDLYMPEMNGDECCRKVKDDPALRSIPFIMVTFAGREKDVLRCREAGCEEILFKPIDRSQLLEKSRAILGVRERLAPRIPARLRVHYGTGGGHLLNNYSVNLSSGGLFLETEDPPPEGTPLQLEFFLPIRPEPIRCKGRVAWVNPPAAKKKPDFPSGMGVQFVDLSLDDMHAIRDFVRQETLTPSW